jgi:hypothetical protein
MNDISIQLIGIGSLPFLKMEDAFRTSTSLDWDYLPQISQMYNMLEEIDLPLDKNAVIIHALKNQWNEKAFKIQVVGPYTLSKAGNMDIKEAYKAILQYTNNLKKLFPRSFIFFDEPILGYSQTDHKYLKLLIDQYGDIGIHCCQNANWDELLKLPFRFVSFDATLSLLNIKFNLIRKDTDLIFGVVSTNDNEDLEVKSFSQMIDSYLKMKDTIFLSPSCGLGNHSILEADDVFNRLRNFKINFEDLLK